MKRLAVWWFWVLVLALTPAVWAQTQNIPEIRSTSPTTGGIQPGVWTLLNFTARNPTDQPVEALAATFFDTTPNTQFLTRFWLPPHSTRNMWQPARLDVLPVAKNIEGIVEGIKLQTILLDPNNLPERQWMRVEALLLPGHNRVTAFIGDSSLDSTLEDMLSALRKGHDPPLHPGLYGLTHRNAPTIVAGWDGIGECVLASQAPDLTLAQIEAMRQWLITGGRLWIMAEQADPHFVQQLLQDDWKGQIVDRVALHDFQVVNNRYAGDLQDSHHEQMHRDPPTDMVRMLLPGTTSLATVAGWPAIAYQRVGLGEVYITTIGSRAWLIPDMDISTKALTGSIKEFGRQFFTDPPGAMRSAADGKPTDLVSSKALQDYVGKQIGRQTVPRGPVLLILGSLAGAMLLAGLVFGRPRRLEYAALTGLVLAVLATGALVYLGAAKQGAVPLTIASVQVAEVLPAQQRLIASGQMAIYSPKADQGPLAANNGGLVWPDFTAQRGTLVRMLWTDIDRWVWQRLALPQGAILPAGFTNVVPVGAPIHVRGRFGPTGFYATLTTGSFGKMDDLLLVAPNGRIFPRSKPTATGAELDAAEGDVLPTEQYLGGNLLSEQQNQRQIVYRQMLEKKLPSRQIRLLGWTNHVDLGFVLPERQQAVRRETTLAALPVEILPAVAGETVSIPSAFLAFTVSSEPPTTRPGQKANREGTHTGSVTMIHPLTGEWLPVNLSVTLYFRFQLPREIGPLQAQRAKLNLDMVAPGRTVELLLPGVTADEVLETIQGPNGHTGWELTGAKLPQPDARGGITLGLRVGNAASVESLWHMQSVSLEVAGQVQAAPRQ